MLHDWQKLNNDKFIHIKTNTAYKKMINDDASIDFNLDGKVPEGITWVTVQKHLKELTEFYQLVQ